MDILFKLLITFLIIYAILCLISIYKQELKQKKAFNLSMKRLRAYKEQEKLDQEKLIEFQKGKTNLK